MSCYDALTGGFGENCERPIKSGIKSRGFIINADDVSEWLKTVNANQFLPVFKAGKTAFPIEVLGAQPFNGTNVASAVSDFTRDFTKTVVFNIPESGSLAALKVEQLTKSQKGFIIGVEGKDAGGDLNGTFVLFGKDEPLLCSVAKDYVAGVSAPVITATSVERGYENFFFSGDLAETKGLFNAIASGVPANRGYKLSLSVDGSGKIMANIKRLFGASPEAAPGYTLVLGGNIFGTTTGYVKILPTQAQLSGDVTFDTGAAVADTSYMIGAALVENEKEFEGNPVYFTSVTASILNLIG